MIRRALPVLFLVAALLVSCNQIKRGAPQIILGAEPEEAIIELKAVAEGNLVAVAVGNYLDHEIPVSCERFAIIITKDKTLIKWNDKTMVSKLPRQNLQPRQKVSGYLRFKAMGDLVGYRLVFDPRPFAEPVYTDIKGSQASPFDNPQDLATTRTLTNPLRRDVKRKTPPALKLYPLK